MIGLVITDEELEEERAAKELFHSLKRYNSSRAARQTAWRVVENFRWRWLSRYMHSHPVPPRLRYWDALNEAPEGWTYPSLRSLEDAEVDELFPGARAAFAYQNIPRSRFVFDQHAGNGGRLKLSVPLNYGGHTITWLPEIGIWRRYCRHISAKPYAKEAACLPT